MTQSPDRALVAESLISAGQLRECVAAARNLQHLLSSITVGPQVLGQVLPDVASALSEYPRVVEGAIACSQRFGFALGSEEQHALVGNSVDKVGALLAVLLGFPGDAPIHARSRLAVEHQLTQVLPSLTSAVAHLDLLLEICQSEASEMTVLELLTSMPERGSDRPHRPISVRTSELGALVSVPPRVALRILSAWLSSSKKVQGGVAGLGVEKSGERVHFSVLHDVATDLVIRLPLFPTSPQTRIVLGAALRPFDGRLDEIGLNFPVQGTGL